jgi:hypothetical protein
MSVARLRQLLGRVLLFTLLTFVLALGAPIMRSVGIFEEDRSDAKHRVELTPIKAVCETSLRHRLPDFLPWDDGTALTWAPLRTGLAQTAPAGHYQVGSPPSRAPPGRLA